MRWQYFLEPELSRSLFRPHVLQAVSSDPFEPVARCLAGVAGRDRLDREIYADLRFTMPDSVLMKVDKMSMSIALEVRVPFLDYELVQFAASIPGRYKLRGLTTKAILRDSLKGILPDNIVGSKQIDPYPNNPDKAKQMLAAAGFPHLTLKFLYRNASEGSSKSFQTIQQDLSKVGITVTGVPSPNADFYVKYLQRELRLHRTSCASAPSLTAASALTLPDASAYDVNPMTTIGAEPTPASSKPKVIDGIVQ